MSAVQPRVHIASPASLLPHAVSVLPTIPGQHRQKGGFVLSLSCLQTSDCRTAWRATEIQGHLISKLPSCISLPFSLSLSPLLSLSLGPLRLFLLPFPVFAFRFPFLTHPQLTFFLIPSLFCFFSEYLYLPVSLSVHRAGAY